MGIQRSAVTQPPVSAEDYVVVIRLHSAILHTMGKRKQKLGDHLLEIHPGQYYNPWREAKITVGTERQRPLVPSPFTKKRGRAATRPRFILFRSHPACSVSSSEF